MNLRAASSVNFVPISLFFRAGGSLISYSPKDMEVYGITTLGAEVLLASGTVSLGADNWTEITFTFDTGGVAYTGIKLKQVTNQDNSSVQAIWREIKIYGYTL